MMRNNENINLKHKKNLTFFTLLELLIVIAVIAIMASLLLPSLNKSRALVKTSSCLNSLKQTYLSVEMYCTDYRTLRIPAEDQSTPVPYMAASPLWQRTLMLCGYVNFPKGFDSSNITSMKGDNIPSQFKCPAASKNLTSSAWAGCHFGINGYLRGKNTTLSWQPNEPLKNPSRVCYFADKMWMMYDYVFPSSLSPEEPFVDFRHNNRADVIFVDGHAKTLTRLQLPMIELKPNAGNYYFWSYRSTVTFLDSADY